MPIWVIWFVLGLVLLIGEIFTPGFLLACFAIGCGVSGVVALLGGGWALQAIFFAVSTILVFFLIRPFALKHLHKTSDKIKTNVEALVGREGLVISDIDPVQGIGRAKVGGEDWRAITSDSKKLSSGNRIVVDRVEGSTIYVSSVQKNKEEDA